MGDRRGQRGCFFASQCATALLHHSLNKHFKCARMCAWEGVVDQLHVHSVPVEIRGHLGGGRGSWYSRLVDFLDSVYSDGSCAKPGACGNRGMCLSPELSGRPSWRRGGPHQFLSLGTVAKVAEARHCMVAKQPPWALPNHVSRIAHLPWEL